MPLILISLVSCDPGVLPPANWEHGEQARTIWRVDEDAVGRVSLDADRVYFPGMHGQLIAVDRSSGQVKWRAKTNPDGSDTFGLGTAVAGDVVAMVDFRLYGFDRRSGQKLWTFSGVGSLSVVNSNPASDGSRFFMGSGDGIAYALSPADGSIIWRTDPPTGYTMLALTSKPHGDLVLVPYNESGAGTRGAVAALDASTGAVGWFHEFKQYVEPHQEAGCRGYVDANDDMVFASYGPGHVIALDRATGTVRWHRSDSPPGLLGAVRRPLALVNQVLIVGAVDGHVEGLDPATGDVLWTRQLEAGSIGFPFAHDGERAYVTPSGRVAALDARTGATVWSHGFRTYDQPWSLTGPGVVDNGVLYIGGAGLFALKR